jgi:hypothetical protein
VPPPVTAPLPPSPQRSSSLGPLIAVVAVLLLLAGGYLTWSGRPTPDTTIATATNPAADAPDTTPASAQPPPPPLPPPPPAPTDTAATPSAAATGAPPAVAVAPPVPAPTTSANQAAATAVATKESQAAKSTPPAGIASATKAASTAAANASKNVNAPPPRVTAPSAGSVSVPPRGREVPAQPAPAAAPPTIPENAAIAFRCSGAPDVCASLHTTVSDALDKAGFRLVTTPDRADIVVGAIADVVDEKASRQFGQNFNTRTYHIELSGEAPKLGDAVSMPPAATVSFDPTVGRERLEEKSRLVASDIVDRVRAYVKKKRGT